MPDEIKKQENTPTANGDNTAQYPKGSTLNDLWKNIESKLDKNNPIGSDEKNQIINILRNKEFRSDLLLKINSVISNPADEQSRSGFQKFIFQLLTPNDGQDDMPSLTINQLFNKYKDKYYKDKEKTQKINLTNIKINFSNACYPNNNSRDNILLAVRETANKANKKSYDHEVVLNPCFRSKPANIKQKIVNGLENLNCILPLSTCKKDTTVKFTVPIQFINDESLPSSLKNKEYELPLAMEIKKDMNNIIVYTGRSNENSQSGCMKFDIFDTKIEFTPKIDNEEKINIWLTGSYLRKKNTFVNLKPGQDQYIGKWWFSENSEYCKFRIKNGPKQDINPDLTKLLNDYRMKYTADGWLINNPPDSSENEIDLANAELGKTLSFCIWMSILHIVDQVSDPASNANSSFFSKGDKLGGIKSYLPARKVDLQPFNLLSELEQRELYYSSSAINSLAMALNSGDHIILTGPPGSGKTTLAREIPKLILKPHLLCTASPEWTTNELIGRYMPIAKKESDTVLEFEPGFFLQAIAPNDKEHDQCKWLIIDELNRADIDSCLGPLFSVLSGHAVVLPYKYVEKKADSGSTDGDHFDQDLPRIGISPENDEPENQDENVHWYKVPGDFRIICTMNDSDAGMLNQLSYALQRRFSVIRVESPNAERVKNFINRKVEKVYSQYKTDPTPGENNSGLGRNLPKKGNDYLKNYLYTLFAARGKDDLMQLRVVGFGQIKDIITMVIEGMSCPPSYNYKMQGQEQESGIKSLILSLLANAVVMKVFPQLPAFICNRDQEEIQESFLPALICIAKVFVGLNYYALKTAVTADNSESRALVIDEDKNQNLLDDYLEKELKLLFRNQHVAWKPYWEAAKFVAAVDKGVWDKAQTALKALEATRDEGVMETEPVKNAYKKFFTDEKNGQDNVDAVQQPTQPTQPTDTGNVPPEA